MDKRKIVFIVDDGLPSGGLYDALKAAGEQLHMDVEVIPLSDTVQGTRPKLAIWDEGPLPVVDFGELETQLCGKYDGITLHTHFGDRDYFNTTDQGTVTGRLSRKHPELQALPGTDKLHAEAWDRLLNVCGGNRQLVKELTFLDRYSSYGRWGVPTMDNVPRKPEKSRYFAHPYGANNNGADHPSRKREPKGPRGQWGKLK